MIRSVRHAAYAIVAVAGSVVSSPSDAASISFRGVFTNDNDVRIINFDVGAPSTVMLRSYSFAGGTLADGTSISSGGFDVYLGLFDSAGTLIDENDDGLGVSADPFTGDAFDALLTADLVAGTYFVSLTQSDNFAIGPALADGFVHDGADNIAFTSAFGCSNGVFCDVGGNNRSGQWALDISGINSAPASTVPLPGTLPLFASGVAFLALLRKKRVDIARSGVQESR